MYNQQVNFDQATPQLTQLFLFTNDRSYGAMMEVFDSGADLSWSQRDPSAKDLKGLWSHTYQLWMSRDAKKAQDVMMPIQESAFPSDEIPAPQTAETSTKNPDSGNPEGANRERERDADWGKTEIDRWLTKIDVNCCRAPSAQMAHCLKEAGYDKKIISRCRELR